MIHCCGINWISVAFRMHGISGKPHDMFVFVPTLQYIPSTLAQQFSEGGASLKAIAEVQEFNWHLQNNGL